MDPNLFRRFVHHPAQRNKYFLQNIINCGKLFRPRSGSVPTFVRPGYEQTWIDGNVRSRYKGAAKVGHKYLKVHKIKELLWYGGLRYDGDNNLVPRE